jgi:hypothetical protein
MDSIMVVVFPKFGAKEHAKQPPLTASTPL